jgi:hypothetical protein
MEIVNGITADAGWTKQIAYSSDGVNWNTLSKANLRVKRDAVTGNTSSPLVESSGKFIVTLLHSDEELLRFKLSDVTNQPTWTNDLAGLQKAVDDINTWIAL